jgi:hypothetical protein
MTTPGATGSCRDCGFFEGGPLAIEQSLPLIGSLSSAHGSSRADDGLCAHHDRFVRASASCADWGRRPSPDVVGLFRRDNTL